jgi:hypothetical protein
MTRLFCQDKLGHLYTCRYRFQDGRVIIRLYIRVKLCTDENDLRFFAALHSWPYSQNRARRASGDTIRRRANK